MRRIVRPLVAAIAASLGVAIAIGPRSSAEELAVAEEPSLRIVGAVQTPKTYALEELRRAPATSETVYFSTGKGPVRATFTGVLLWSLLQEAGIAVDPAVKNDILRHTIAVTGSDGYRVVLSAGELDPEFGGELAILAYARDGQPLGPNGGFVRLIVPGDKGGGRNVASIVEIEVR